MSGWDLFQRLIALETDDCIEWPMCVDGGGYGQVSMPRPNGRGRILKTHRLALIERAGPPPAGKPFAIHGPCHNRRCINYRHLRWGTPSENMLDRKRDGTEAFPDNAGEQNPNAKLTPALVLDIRRRAAHGENMSAIGRALGVTRGAVHLIVSRQRWAHL